LLVDIALIVASQNNPKFLKVKKAFQKILKSRAGAWCTFLYKTDGDNYRQFFLLGLCWQFKTAGAVCSAGARSDVQKFREYQAPELAQALFRNIISYFYLTRIISVKIKIIYMRTFLNLVIENRKIKTVELKKLIPSLFDKT
jgi:hypothetical protein